MLPREAPSKLVAQLVYNSLQQKRAQMTPSPL